nr:helix-turn-helix domain-containing protein [uncultured Roseateles sp.]
MTSSPPLRIAVVAYDRISPFHLAVPCVVFGEDRSDTGVPPFDLRVCALDPAPLRTSIGFTIGATQSLSGLARADIIIVPSWRDPDERPPAPLLVALQRAHGRGARIVGLCLGAFVLAEAGLLDGRTATTHWAWADRFAQRYPAVRLDRDVIYVDDGTVLTSAGTAAGLDCCLHLLRQSHGAEIANRVARRLVIAPHRQGGQAQYIEQPLPATGADHRLSEVLAWATEHLAETHSLDALASRAVMTRRTFTRHFRQITGTTVGQWLLHQRLASAQRLLETTELKLEQIAAETGLGSALSMRQHFASQLKTSPSAYRKQFRGD